MNRYTKLIVFLLLGVVIFSGCRRPAPPVDPTPQTKTETIKIFYGDSENARLVEETREITYQDGEEKYTAAINEQLKLPTTAGLRRNIPEGTKLIGITKDNGYMIVNLSREFSGFGGSVQEIVAIASIVNTATQFEEVNRVKIIIEGEEYIGPSGEPLGYIEPFKENIMEGTTEVLLYFSNADATRVVPEARLLNIPEDTPREELIKEVLRELIKGPSRADLGTAIPKEVTVNSVTFDGDIVHVDFSHEMHTKHAGGAAGEAMTINSIVATLTEFENIRLVKMTVEGEPLAIEHAIMDEPVGRTEEMIQR